MRSILFAFILLLVFEPFKGNCQIEKKYKLNDRLVFGGNFGFQFGSVTQVDISPLAGYKITPKYIAGIGLTYQYFKDNQGTYGNVETNIYGGRIFMKYAFIPQAFVQSEYEVLSLESRYFDILKIHADKQRFLLHSLLVGGGLKQSIGERSAVNLTILFNLIESANNPYSNPVIRIGFDF